MRSALISNAAGEVPEREDWFLQSTFFTLTVAQCLGVHDSSVKLGISNKVRIIRPQTNLGYLRSCYEKSNFIFTAINLNGRKP